MRNRFWDTRTEGNEISMWYLVFSLHHIFSLVDPASGMWLAALDFCLTQRVICASWFLLDFCYLIVRVDFRQRKLQRVATWRPRKLSLVCLLSECIHIFVYCLESSEITIPTGNLTFAYDPLGNSYVLPCYLLSRPTNFDPNDKAEVVRPETIEVIVDKERTPLRRS